MPKSNPVLFLNQSCNYSEVRALQLQHQETKATGRRVHSQFQVLKLNYVGWTHNNNFPTLAGI